MRIAIGLCGVLALASVLCWSGAAVAMVPHITLSEMTESSQSIVYGQVISLVPHWDEGRRAIHTTVTIEPFEYMKGEPGGGRVTFEMPGGVVGEIGLAVSDVPEFEVGEEVVLFLRPEYFQVVGWYQGKFSVRDGVVLEQNMHMEEFRAHIAELTGLSGAESGIRGDGGVIIRRATFTAPAPAGDRDRSSLGTGGPEPEPAPNAEVVIMTEDFEGVFPPPGDWTRNDQNGTGHKWGVETYTKHAGSNSMWECADGASGLPSGSNYAPDMKTWAIYGPFDLSDANAAELRFWRSVETASLNDFVFWAASANGTNFDGFIGFAGDGTWISTTLNLSAYLGDGDVWIAFMFQSDDTGTNKGAFIDDVELIKTIPDVGDPVIDSISPDTGPAGAGFSVTITGSDFGAEQGGSEVQFVYDPSSTPTIAADVISSWSDTLIICEVPEQAGSGLVHVVVGGDAGTGKDFTVTYGASSYWWQAPEPMGENMVINPNCADDPAEDVLAACIRGFQEWNAESGGDYSFTYGGPTEVTGHSWNYANEIAWGSTGGSLATNYSYYSGSEIVENDIIFDDVSWVWSAGGAADEYDIQSVMTHELGHCLRLRDLYGVPDQGKTMYGRISTGQTDIRTIEQSERLGLQHFYGAQSLNITTGDLPDATAPVLYSAAITAVGGAPPRTFELRSGPGLPDGLTLSAGGVVSGFCKEEGTFYVNVRVTDDELNTDSQVIKLHVELAAPVALEQFSATPVNEGVLVEWDLAADSDLGEFYVRRSVADRDGYYEVLNQEAVSAVDRSGGTFSYLDQDVVEGTLYYYKLETRGGVLFGPVSAVASLGRTGLFRLGQNRPNPFSPGLDGVTVMTFSVPAPAHATVRIYDVVGRLVATPLDDGVGSGKTDVMWNGTDREGNAAPSGVYFYELYTDGFHSTRKMTLMK